MNYLKIKLCLLCLLLSLNFLLAQKKVLIAYSKNDKSILAFDESGQLKWTNSSEALLKPNNLGFIQNHSSRTSLNIHDYAFGKLPVSFGGVWMLEDYEGDFALLPSEVRFVSNVAKDIYLAGMKPERGIGFVYKYLDGDGNYLYDATVFSVAGSFENGKTVVKKSQDDSWLILDISGETKDVFADSIHWKTKWMSQLKDGYILAKSLKQNSNHRYAFDLLDVEGNWICNLNAVIRENAINPQIIEIKDSIGMLKVNNSFFVFDLNGELLHEYSTEDIFSELNYLGTNGTDHLIGSKYGSILLDSNFEVKEQLAEEGQTMQYLVLNPMGYVQNIFHKNPQKETNVLVVNGQKITETDNDIFAVLPKLYIEGTDLNGFFPKYIRNLKNEILYEFK